MHQINDCAIPMGGCLLFDIPIDASSRVFQSDHPEIPVKRDVCSLVEQRARSLCCLRALGISDKGIKNIHKHIYMTDLAIVARGKALILALVRWFTRVAGFGGFLSFLWEVLKRRPGQIHSELAPRLLEPKKLEPKTPDASRCAFYWPHTCVPLTCTVTQIEQLSHKCSGLSILTSVDLPLEASSLHGSTLLLESLPNDTPSGLP